MSIQYYVLGGPRYKPPGVSIGSPRLRFILMCMLMQLFVCCDRNKVQFSSTYITLIGIHLQLCSVNVAIAVCFRVKCLMSKVGSVKGLLVEKMAYSMGKCEHLLIKDTVC